MITGRGLLILHEHDEPAAEEVLTRRELRAQQGNIIGMVTDEYTGEVLQGATVHLSETAIGAVTNQDGRFTLRRIPVGEHVLLVRYMGYNTKEIQVSITAEESIVQNIELEADQIMGDNVLVIGYQRGQSRALTRQRESVNIRSVLSSEQIDRMMTTTVSDALSRVTGMHGGTNIRGVGSAMSNVTVDGQRMGSTGSGDRSVDLSTISSDMVQELDVIKVITPDMDADALAGVINVSTRRPIGADRSLDIRLGGGSTPRYHSHTGPSSRFAVNFGDSPSDVFSYSVNFSYQKSPRTSESFETNWDIRNFGEGPVDVLERLATSLEFDPRERYGGGVQLTFQPSARTTFHLQGMVNSQVREANEYGMDYRPRVELYVSQFETNNVFGTDTGHIRYNAQLGPSTINQYTFRAGARHLFEAFDMEYNVGWGHGRFDRDRYRFRFESPRRYDYIVGLEDRHNPTLDFVNRPYPNQNLFDLDYVYHRWDEHIDNELSGAIDFSVPFNRGTFKFGSSTRLTLKNGASEEFYMDFDRASDLSMFDMIVNADWNILGRDHHHTYQIPWLMDLNAGKDFFYSQYPHMELDLELWAESAETSKFNAMEHTTSAYGMTNLNLGRFNFLGGLRVEHTSNVYDGREGVINSQGRFVGAKDVNNTSDYIYLFPNAQLVFGVADMTNVRLAYSRSIGRPDFSRLAPYRLLNYDSETIRRGNPDLKPMISDNFDLLFEHYFMNVGELTLGFYYKQLSEFVYSFEDRIQDGEFSGWRERTYLNGEEATIYGVEVSWQQNLEFLPSFLGNFGTFANYSYSRSFADLDRDEPAPMIDQRPHIANVGLDYNQGGLSASMFYSWSSAVLTAYGSLQWVPEIQLRERVYFDRYEDGRNNLSASVRYRISSNFRIWVDASNILAEETVQYFHNRDYYPNRIRYSTRSFTMGIRYNI